MPASPPRLLRLADPLEEGDDVRAVQKAVKSDAAEPFADGIYDVATALAVMRFQKAHGLNVDGTVDAAMREKLGLPPQEPAPKAPAPKTPTPAPKN
jgi:peptidoglycan hydrolase-like protein with peptidoglycan-binding domain